MFRTIHTVPFSRQVEEEESEFLLSDTADSTPNRTATNNRNTQLWISEDRAESRRRYRPWTIQTLLRTNNRVALFLIGFLFFIMITVGHINKGLLNQSDKTLTFMRDNPFLDSYLRPNNESCLICSNTLEKECQTVLLSENSHDRLLVYFVTTSPENRLNRDVIRSTWGEVVFPRPVFITGYSDNLSVMDQLVIEAREFKDIIIEDFHDSYRNLTLKTGFILKQFLSLCPSGDFLIKTDDDMFIQPDLFQKLLATANLDHLVGNVQTDATPYRDQWSKYYLPWWLFNETRLPEFISGWTYVLPGRQVQEIFDASLAVPVINLEDVFFTGLVARRTLNLTLTNDERFRTKAFHGRNLCLYKPYAAYHRLPPKKLANVWHRVQNLSMDICDNAIQHEREKEEKEERKSKGRRFTKVAP